MALKCFTVNKNENDLNSASLVFLKDLVESWIFAVCGFTRFTVVSQVSPLED